MSANLIAAQMLFLESEDPGKDIQLYINSPGGSVTAGMMPVWERSCGPVEQKENVWPCQTPRL